MARKWTEDEQTQFLNLFNSGHTKEEIAAALGRSPLSIEFRLKAHVVTLHNNGLSNDEIVTLTKLTPEQVTEALETALIKSAASRKGARWTEEEVINLLTALRRNKPHISIAKDCQRTLDSVTAKIESLAYTYYHEDKKSVTEIATLLKLSEEEVTYIVSKTKVKKAKSKPESNESNEIFQPQE